MGLVRKRSVVGLEMDSDVIRAVEIKGSKQNGRIVTAAGELAIPPVSVVNGVVRDVFTISESLQELWQKAKFGSRRVVLGFFNRDLMIRLITFPKVPADKLKQALFLQAEEYFPFPPAEMVMDCFILGEREEERGPLYEVLLAACKKKQLEMNISAVIKSGLDPVVVDAVPLALFRLLAGERKQGAVVMADLAMGESSIILAKDGKPRFARALPVQLQQYLGKAGAALPAQGDFTAAKPRTAEKDVLRRFCASAAAEIRNSVDYYMEQEQIRNIDRIIFGGRGAAIPEIIVLLQDELGIPCEAACPPNAVACAGKGSVDVSGPEFAVSCGLAMRGLEE